MATVRVHNHKIVITDNMIKSLHPKEGDQLEIQEVGGVVVISKIRPAKNHKGALAYFGAGKKHAQFHDIKEVDDFIRNERESWEH